MNLVGGKHFLIFHQFLNVLASTSGERQKWLEHFWVFLLFKTLESEFQNLSTGHSFSSRLGPKLGSRLGSRFSSALSPALDSALSLVLRSSASPNSKAALSNVGKHFLPICTFKQFLFIKFVCKFPKKMNCVFWPLILLTTPNSRALLDQALPGPAISSSLNLKRANRFEMARGSLKTKSSKCQLGSSSSRAEDWEVCRTV